MRESDSGRREKERRGGGLEKREWKTQAKRGAERNVASWTERTEPFDLRGEKEGEIKREKERVPRYKGRQRKSAKRGEK